MIVMGMEYYQDDDQSKFLVDVSERNGSVYWTKTRACQLILVVLLLLLYVQVFQRVDQAILMYKYVLRNWVGFLSAPYSFLSRLQP